MTTTELELRRLIYGMTNTIVVSDDPKEALTQIELVKGSMQIEGFIFKSNFAATKKLTKFNEEDWAAMFAQYALTYGWNEDYQLITGESAYDTLSSYLNRTPDVPFDVPETGSAVPMYGIKSTKYYVNVLESIAKSKTVLREQQIRIINLMPVWAIEMVYGNTKIVIKETEILFIKKLIENGSDIKLFNDADQIVRFVVSNFRANGEPVTGQLNKAILKDVKLKIPTSFKKKLWKEIDRLNPVKAVQDMYKFHSFWKRLFKQLKYTGGEKIYNRFTKASKIRNSLYTEDVFKRNHDIETLKASGDLAMALRLEAKNPGQMARNLIQYLRYSAGDAMATKVKPGASAVKMHDLMLKKKSTGTRVMSPVDMCLETAEFYDALLRVNVKLLWQLRDILSKENTLIYESRTVKKMNNVRIKYEGKGLPGVRKDLAKIVRKKIKNAIKQVKRAENSTLGKVYLDPEVKNYVVQQSGRNDTSISLSGEYLYPGSKINLSELIPEKDNDKLILRIGLAWRGKSSCDIDLSMNIEGHTTVYYGNNVLEKDGDIIISSSGDITSCGNELLSTEFIDVDLGLFKKHGFTSMFNSAIVFSGSTFKDYEAYWFMSVMKKKDRVSPGRRIEIKLDDMDYACQITEDNKKMIGLRFEIDPLGLSPDYAEVLNIPVDGSRNGTNATMLDEAMAQLPPRSSMKKALEMSINKQQFVDDIQFADIVISANPSLDLPFEVEVIHPGRDNTRLQEIIF